MGILKRKLQIVLVGAIAYQGYLLIGMFTGSGQTPSPAPSDGPAHAEDGFVYANTEPEDLTMAPSGTDIVSMQDLAAKEANKMMKSGDTRAYKKALMDDPLAVRLFGLD